MSCFLLVCRERPLRRHPLLQLRLRYLHLPDDEDDGEPESSKLLSDEEDESGEDLFKLVVKDEDDELLELE